MQQKGYFVSDILLNTRRIITINQKINGRPYRDAKVYGRCESFLICFIAMSEEYDLHFTLNF